ncbi:MFS transporter [Catenulispora subtropica]|uniref:MFS transporter n=1 Tax=Catenulispora subtropica TaxID=450798 RepID=UPI0031E32DB5
MTDTLTGPAPRRSLWRHRDFLLLWGGQAVSEIGSAITMLAVPLAAVLLLDAGTFQVGLLTAMSTLPFLLVALPAGALVDRAAKHRLMMWCDVGRLLLLGSVPLATLPGLRLTYPHLLVVALLTGVLTVFFDVAYQSYLPVLLDKEDLVDGNGKLGTTAAFAQFAGPALGGVLVGLLGAARSLIADAATYAVSAVTLFLIRTPEPAPHPAHGERRIRDDVKEGLHFVVKHPILRRIVACTGTGNLFNAMMLAVETPFMVRVLDLEPGGVGLVLTLGACGGIVGGLIARPLANRFGSARIIWLSPLVIGLPAFLAPLATPGWGVLLYAAGLAFFGMMAVVYNVAQVSYRQAITPHALLGRMNASVRFIVWGTMPLGALLGGLLGTWFGLRATVWIAVLGSYAAVAWVFFSPLRSLRDVPLAAEPTPDPV